MSERVALLGWGSLLWDADDEFDLLHEPWLFDGPELSIEFSRISKSRHGALTLVIDRENGIATTVAYSVSKRTRISDAMADLRKREKTGERGIGWLKSSGGGQCRDGISMLAIRKWAHESSFDGVVWTDLPSNFQKETKRPFSVDAAVAYVTSLNGEGRSMAIEYITRAPDFVQTPIRRAFAGQ